MGKMEVDIIMGVFNEQKTIKRAIDSILEQDYLQWKLLICDDGSTDETVSIIENYVHNYPDKIVLYRNERNRGLTYSLNRLLKYSTARYIARMDADDYSVPSRIRVELEFLEKNPQYAMVGSAIEKFDKNGVFATVLFSEKPSRKSLLWNSPFAHPTIMIRREVILSLHGYRDLPKTKRCEDYDLWFRLYARGFLGYNIQTPLLKYFEDRSSYKKRKYRYRINEMRVRFEGYLHNHLMPIGLAYAIKPLLVGLIPYSVIQKFRRLK